MKLFYKFSINILIFIFLVASISYTQAGKSDQFFVDNYTCENFTQVTNWGAVGTKSVAKDEYYNWTIETDSPGQKDKDIFSIYSYSRYISAGAKDPIGPDEAYSQIANNTEGFPPASWTGIRYNANINQSLEDGLTLGPYWECAASASPNTCDTSNQGFDNISQQYSVHVYAFGGSPNKFAITDVFNVRYQWCWTPIIFNANVSQETGGWGSNFTFTINVTNPSANTTVKLWRRQIGQPWQQIGSEKSCANCSGHEGGDSLSWTTSFTCDDIGEWEFKFNATDDAGYSEEAWASGITNECLDNENDCIFEILADKVNYTILAVDYYQGGAVTPDDNATLKLQAFDITKGTNIITADSLFVDFKVEKSAGGGDFQTLVPASTTNTTGYLEFLFTPTTPPFSTGESNWYGETSAATVCYDINQSANSTVNIQVEDIPTPVFVNETVNGETSGVTAGWGSNWTFSVNISNPATGEGDINLTLQVDTGSGFVDIETKTCTDPCSSSTKFTFFVDNFTCLTPPTSSEYKFKATNLNGTDYTSAHSFTMDKDNIIFEYILGNNSIANRRGNQLDLLILRINDTDKGEYISNGTNVTFYVEYNDVSFDSGNINETNSTGYVNYYFNPECSPTKYLVGDRAWKASTLETAVCYKAVTSEIFNLSIIGDISLDFTNPTGTTNYTQEDTISFLGATTDDCTDALEATVVYNSNSSENSFACSDTTQIGANAFQCIFQTYLNTTRGWYNMTMLANVTNHYDNLELKESIPGLLYIFPKKKLLTPTAVPESQGWGYPNWNFSVIASSGDPDNNLTMGFYIGDSINPTSQCTSPTCINETSTSCNNCDNKKISWLRNFTYSDIGIKYYQFKLDDAEVTSTSGTDFTIQVAKDDTNITYVAGNATTVIYQTQPQNLSVRVFDIDKDSYNVTQPQVIVTFKLLDDSYPSDEKIIGTSLTNESGYATFEFNMSSCDYVEGNQIWMAEINSSEPNYNQSVSENFTIILEATGCEATISISNILTPEEVFSYKNFTTNSTISAFISSANNVYTNLTTPTGWITGNQTQSLGTISIDSPVQTSWITNATTSGQSNVSIYANSSNAGNDTATSSNFQVYKYLEESSPIESLPITLIPNEEEIFSWNCEAGNYRVASITTTLDSISTKARLEAYNGLSFVDILHSEDISSLNTKETTILENQISPNETGFCRIKVTNLGGNDLNISNISLRGYYSEAVRIEDIFTKVSGIELTGIETDEELFNLSVRLRNSLNEQKSLSLTLNITNESGVVESITNSSITLQADSILLVNFTNINTTSWNEGNYNLEAYLSGDETDERNESLVFNDVKIFGETINKICDSINETFSVTIYHPFEDEISYNVGLEVPAGWSYSGPQSVNISSPGNTTLIFNFTSGGAGNFTINATANYTYIQNPKQEKIIKSIENGITPMLEVIRETPKTIMNNTEFISNIILRNKGCADILDSQTPIIFTDNIPAGWVAFSPTLDGVSAGVADIPEGKIIFDSGSIDKIRQNDYRIISYKVLSPASLSQEGDFRYNFTWGENEDYEKLPHVATTATYSEESHLEFGLLSYESWKDRSTESGTDQQYNLTVKNIGDTEIINGTWQIKLSIPSQCSPSNYTNATFSNGKITWNLSDLAVAETTYFNFNMNCSNIPTELESTMLAEGIRDNKSIFIFYDNIENLICEFTSGSGCSSIDAFTFAKPLNPRYEKLNNINFSIIQNLSGYAPTITQAYVNISDDNQDYKRIWQNHSYNAISNTLWTNYTLDASQQNSFTEATRNIGINAYVSATDNQQGSIQVDKIDYTWNNGKLFNDNQSLFFEIHPFVFDLPTPVQQAPLNDSLQVATPVGLSWESIPAPQGVNITYYILGDKVDGSTVLDSTTDALYLWRNIDSGTYFWRIIANDGTTNKSSQTWQFNLDVCQPDTGFSYALDYPMSYDLATDTITVWGNATMGNNETNAITFEQIYEFGRAARGVCAIIKPAEGSYAVLSRLELGNTSSALNTTFAKTTGESIDFGKQLQLNFNATLISGQLSGEGSPFAGSTLSFSGVGAIDSEQGEFYLLNGSELRMYDTGVSHKISANNSNPFRLYWNGDVKVKSSTMQNWYTIRFLGKNNSLEDIIITDVGEGFYPATTQTGLLDSVISRKTIEDGFYLFNDSNVSITSLEISETDGEDIGVINYTGVADLINPSINFASINWTTGIFSGGINRKYTYLSTITDVTGGLLESASLILLDVRGDNVFNLNTDVFGAIPEQTVTRAIYDYLHKTGDERGPHILKIKKFGKAFVNLAKQFSAATVEVIQLNDNPFVELTEAQVLNLTGISYNPPIKVNYGDEINSSWSTSGQLQNNPLAQSEFFALFANGTKLIEGAAANFTINYDTGEIFFNSDVSGYDIYSVYSYGGDITITTGTASENCIDMDDLYSYMQYNLSDVLSTVDGVTYNSYVDLVIGNSTTGGCIIDSTSSLLFADGYTYSFSTAGGYIDLYGITSGGGSGGGLPLNIFDDVGIFYKPGDDVYIFSTTLDSTGELVSSDVSITVYYPNNTIISSGSSSEVSIGRFRYNFTLPDPSPVGTYKVDIDATYLDNEVHDTLAFQIASDPPVSYPIIQLEASTPIATTSDASIVALVISSTGIQTNCDGPLRITIADLADNSVEDSGDMTSLGIGLYEYSWTTPVDASVFYINTSCTISGANYTGFTMISTQPVGAQATVDYNQIAFYVWNYTSRNLTWYNQSVAENLELCLKDAQCSDWWINTSMTNIEEILGGINSSMINIENNTQELLSSFDCNETSEICTILSNILSNTTESNSLILTLNGSLIPDLQSDIDSIYNDTQWLLENVATQTNISEISTAIENIQSNITFIKNNMFYQGNATGTFLVDYLSTVFGKPGSKMELWIQTRDLLGNPKTATSANCTIEKDGLTINNATTTITNDTIYSSWNVSENISSGSYNWNCTITGSTLNLKVPFYISGSFGITSLVTSSPKYPNEAALIEATFADSEGNDMNPDTINLTILQPPTYATPWVTAIIDDFAQVGNVWRYTKSIESTPTTGTYLVHMTAGYGDIVSSRTTQFRIATGGPYMVVLNCPDSSDVGSNLYCDVVIQDEGEAATESTCTTWVDTNNNQAADATEPQVQFSKETLPQENVTQPISINVPGTHPTGSYIVRTLCSYANSGQPPSGASDFVLFEGEQIVTPPSAGGGAGAAAIEAVRDFSLDKEILKVSLLPGETREENITITNLWNEEMNFIVWSSDIEDFVKIAEPQFSINAGESKVLNINFTALRQIIPELYIGKLIVASENLEKEILVAIDVGSEEALFDVRVEVPEKFQNVFPGQEVLASLNIINLGTQITVNATIEYIIKNEAGKTIAQENETIEIFNRIGLIKSIMIPKGTSLGRHIFYARVNYEGKVASSSDVFTVKRDWMRLIIILIIILIVSFIVFFSLKEKKLREKLRRRAFYQRKENQNKYEKNNKNFVGNPSIIDFGNFLALLRKNNYRKSD